MQALALFLLLVGQQAPKEPPADDDATRRELNDLRIRQSGLELRLNAAELRLLQLRRPDVPQTTTVVAPAPLPEPTGPRFRFGRGSGFAIATADGQSEVRLRLVLHFDGRSYLGDAPPSSDTFVMRRVRPFIEGTLWDVVSFRLMPDFPQGQAVLQDAYIEMHPWRWLRVRGGRFMVPIGLEWLQSDSTILLVERSLVTDLVPFRDLGVMISGDLGNGFFAYQFALLNGSPDSGNGPDMSLQSDKDYVGRLFVRPFRATKIDVTNLGFGVAGSYCDVHGTTTAPGLPGYRSTGQETIFNYLNDPMSPSGVVVAQGPHWRVAPQLYWYLGPFGMIAEYVRSSQSVQRMAAAADLEHDAWNLEASFVLTLERAAYEGVVPAHPIDFRHKNFGAFEIVGRYSELQLDPGTFPVFAATAVSVQSARETAGGLNWYMTDFVRIMLTFEHTEFTGGAPVGNRPPENGLLGRFQIAL
jgi:phosphate-selective porin OprO and OprP